MGARVRLAKNATTTQPSIRVRLADPPFDFVVSGTWGGTVAIEATQDAPSTFPPFDPLVADAAATWRTLYSTAANGDFTWSAPLYRVRANLSGVTSGSVTVDMMEGIRSVKNERSNSNNRKPTSQQRRASVS